MSKRLQFAVAVVVAVAFLLASCGPAIVDVVQRLFFSR